MSKFALDEYFDAADRFVYFVDLGPESGDLPRVVDIFVGVWGFGVFIVEGSFLVSRSVFSSPSPPRP